MEEKTENIDTVCRIDGREKETVHAYTDPMFCFVRTMGGGVRCSKKLFANIPIFVRIFGVQDLSKNEQMVKNNHFWTENNHFGPLEG